MFVLEFWNILKDVEGFTGGGCRDWWIDSMTSCRCSWNAEVRGAVTESTSAFVAIAKPVPKTKGSYHPLHSHYIRITVTLHSLHQTGSFQWSGGPQPVKLAPWSLWLKTPPNESLTQRSHKLLRLHGQGTVGNFHQCQHVPTNYGKLKSFEQSSKPSKPRLVHDWL